MGAENGNFPSNIGDGFPGNMSNFFPALIQKMFERGRRAESGQWNGKDTSFKDILFGILGDVAPKPRTGINTYTRNVSEQAVLTNRTVKAIEQVIPMWLSKIYSAITGNNERMYDYSSGKLIDTRRYVSDVMYRDNDFTSSMGEGASSLLRAARQQNKRFADVKDYDEFQNFVN